MGKKLSKKPVHKKWWFWTIIGIILASAIALLIVLVAVPKSSKHFQDVGHQEWYLDGEEPYVLILAIRNHSSIDKHTCIYFGNLAYDFDSNAGWFDDSFCDYPNFFFGSYETKGGKKILSIKKDGKTASYYYNADDSDYNLVDYTFTNDPAGVLDTFITIDEE